jgi:hypothetical protein
VTAGEELQARLAIEANLFREWARDYLVAHTASGEWECDYPDWGRTYGVVDEYLRLVDVVGSPRSALADLLYLLARDNECENIAESIATAQGPAGVLFLAECAIELSEADARWQLAVRLGELSNGAVEARNVESVLLAFMRDENEYVRRRSLQALASQRPTAVEPLALAEWEESHEAQEWTRMNVLEVLRQVGSDRLPELLHQAANDPRPHLAAFARNILAGKPGWSPGQ